MRIGYGDTALPHDSLARLSNIPIGLFGRDKHSIVRVGPEPSHTTQKARVYLHIASGASRQT